MAEAAAGAKENAGGGGSLGSRLVDLVFQALPAIAGTVGFVGFVAVLGGVIQWVRFDAVQLPAAQAVHSIPRGELVAIGAELLILFTILGLAATIFVYVADPRGEGNAATARVLVVITAAECIVVLVLVPTAWDALVWSALLVALLAVLASLVVGPLWALARDATSVTHLHTAQRRWEEAADAAEVERALGSSAAVAALPPDQAAVAIARRSAADRRLVEAEAAWERLVASIERDIEGAGLKWRRRQETDG